MITSNPILGYSHLKKKLSKKLNSISALLSIDSNEYPYVPNKAYKLVNKIYSGNYTLEENDLENYIFILEIIAADIFNDPQNILRLNLLKTYKTYFPDCIYESSEGNASPTSHAVFIPLLELERLGSKKLWSFLKDGFPEWGTKLSIERSADPIWGESDLMWGIGIYYDHIKKLALNSSDESSIKSIFSFLKCLTNLRPEEDIPEWIDWEMDRLSLIFEKQRVHSELLDWEILPNGWWLEPEYRKHFIEGISNKNDVIIILERLDYLQSLKPMQSFRSKFGNREYPYYVFVFNKCVVAECPVDGNAIYLIKDTSRWKQLLQLPKRELRAHYSEVIRKIDHRGEWQARLKNEIS